MDFKIKWIKRAWLTFEANINYLQNRWTSKEMSTFVIEVDKRLKNLSKYPGIGNSRNKKQADIRSVTIHKRVVLIYRYKPKLKEIHLLVFWNTA
jgi:plasmid stabilization system protein ParE